MPNLYCINEFSIISFCIAVATGKKPYVIEVQPAIVFFRPTILKFVKFLEKVGLVSDIKSLVPIYEPEIEDEQRLHFHDVFAKIEPNIKKQYKFDYLLEFLPRYGRAIQVSASLHISQRLLSIFLIPHLLKTLPETTKIYGVLPDIATSIGVDTPQIKKTSSGFRIINFVLTSICFLKGVIWCFRRIRFSNPGPIPIAFAADYTGDLDDENIFSELREAGEILLVARNSHLLEVAIKKKLPYKVCSSNDGVLSLLESIRVLLLMCQEMYKIYSVLGNQNPGLFYRTVPLPLRRAEYQAMFNKYKPKVFWGRDGYDPRHVLRKQELNKLGGSSWSVCQSFLPNGTAYPEFCYLFFDRYYVLGRGFYDTYYKTRWNKEIKVISAASRASITFPRVPMSRKPNDILVMCSPFIMEERMIDFVRYIARHFNDRLIYLQIKKQVKETSSGSLFLKMCQDNLDNIVNTNETIYQLFSKVRFGFSDPATPAVEAPQFGVYGFALDLSNHRKSEIYRQIPGFSISSGKEGVKRIRDIESGHWDYPAKEINKYIYLSGKNFGDQIRGDMGLAEKHRDISIWDIE